MKLLLLCPKCQNNRLSELTDNNHYVLDCKCGETTKIWLQNPKYELLFESGVLALCDGYKREAISSITASLERFYEICIKTICFDLECNDIFHQSWKEMGRSSERQLGAYIFTYSLRFKETPKILSRKLTEFRNDVIHNGKFPSFDEVLEYLEQVAIIISNVKEMLKTSCKDKEICVLLQDAVRSSADGSFSTLAIQTFLNSYSSQKQFRTHFEEFKLDYCRALIRSNK